VGHRRHRLLIDGNAPGLSPEGLDAYARFSPDGIVAQKIPPAGVHGTMPFLRMGADLPHEPAEAASVIIASLRGDGPRFAVCRSILKPPSWYVAVGQELERQGGDVVVVDLYTLLWLVRRHEQDQAGVREGGTPVPPATPLLGEPVPPDPL
jgi:hypothetical protein